MSMKYWLPPAILLVALVGYGAWWTTHRQANEDEIIEKLGQYCEITTEMTEATLPAWLDKLLGRNRSLRSFSPRATELTFQSSWDLDDAALEDIGKLSSIRTLRFRTGENYVASDGLQPLANLPNLTTLDLNFFVLSDAGMEQIFKLDQLVGAGHGNVYFTRSGLIHSRRFGNCVSTAWRALADGLSRGGRGSR